MNLAVQRIVLTDYSTCGNLFVNDALECWTLELPRKDGLHGSCITAGTYPVMLNASPKFSGDKEFVALCKTLNVPPLMPELLNVPNREDIRIHWGNWPRDTEGCILLGKSHQTDAIGQSRDAFAEFYKLVTDAVANGEHITLEVLDPPNLGSSQSV